MQPLYWIPDVFDKILLHGINTIMATLEERLQEVALTALELRNATSPHQYEHMISESLRGGQQTSDALALHIDRLQMEFSKQLKQIVVKFWMGYHDDEPQKMEQIRETIDHLSTKYVRIFTKHLNRPPEAREYKMITSLAATYECALHISQLIKAKAP